MVRDEYFGFAINEFRYRRVKFTRSYTREAAERRNRVVFRHEIDPVSADLEVIIIKGRKEFEDWAKECNYEIDWVNKYLIYKGE
jgi:hypothetical protein